MLPSHAADFELQPDVRCPRSSGAVVLLPRVHRPQQQRRDADASSVPCAASLLQCVPNGVQLAVVCCHAGGHRTAVHAVAARRMDADAVSHAPAGGGALPVKAADLRILQPARLSTQVRSQVMPAAAAARRRCCSSVCAASLVAASASGMRRSAVQCCCPRLRTLVSAAPAQVQQRVAGARGVRCTSAVDAGQLSVRRLVG